MINIDNLKDVLTKLEFEETDNVYSKSFEQGSFVLKADFNKNRLEYPEKLKVWGEFTTNFARNENFVVFECVHRLLDKGYKPEHIELEKKWDLGGGAKGGRADILVLDQQRQPLLIIECKTAGKEFEKEWKDTLLDGGQLFTYLQQDNETQFLCLYASDFDEASNEIILQQRIISVKDNEQILLTDSKLKSFKEANNVKQAYLVWKNTYQSESDTRGIFEKNIPAYSIGKAHYTLEDLQIIAENDIQKKYHEFASILRQYNVSGRENAFDKLVNLFLAKIVDEKHHPQNLQFRWRGISADNYFSFIDRLEKLYTNGMKEFLKEEVTFVEQSMVIDAFKYVKNDPDATRETVLKHFRRQKYFTNNDFSFIDVHNEKLFYQNVVILRQMVQMIENIQLNGDQQNQFLGDLFEGFLDRGVKQSEGQFFTPMPIVKFILMSLPLKHLVVSGSEIPKAIDYACGSGHFLTELAAQLKTIVEETKTEISAKEFYSNLYGIEKEYRLSKVAKVSAFMYSQDEINVYYADALTPHEAIKNNSFNLLVANPPFAVKGFLETLSEEERNAFSLTEQISDLSKNNNIQCFFLERAKQLLKVGGMTGIIVPSSVLSNSDTTHIATREMLLQYFDIVALSEFGNRTFGKTGTNTVVLFLRKKDDNPPPNAHYKERVDSWFSPNDAKKQIVYIDQHFIQQYCDHVEIQFDDYIKLLQASDDTALIETLMAYEIFKDYKVVFKKTEDKIRETQRKETFRKEKEWTNKYRRENTKATEKQIEKLVEADLDILAQNHTKILHKVFIESVQKIEKDKLYYFVLAKTNPQKVLIIKSPVENAAQKKFLGYDWSGSKGSEGIKYLASSTVTVTTEEDEDDRVLQNLNAKRSINTPLFDNNKAENATKINYYIQQNFLKQPLSIPENLQPFLTLARLEDLLDFSQKTFNKVVSLSSKKVVFFDTKWSLVKVADLNVLLRRGKSTQYGTSNIQVIKSGQARGHKRFDFKEKFFTSENFLSDERNLRRGDLLINSTGVGTAGRVTFFDLEGDYVADSHITIFRTNEKILPEFALQCFTYIGFKEIEQMAVGATGQIELSLDIISNIKIPLPPLSIQRQIVAACEAIDQNVSKAQVVVEVSKNQIEAIAESVYGKYEEKRLSDLAVINPSKTELKGMDETTLISFVEMASVSDKGFILEKIVKPYKELKKGSYTYFAENDIIIAKITPCMENGKCALAIGLTNALAMGSSEFHVIRAKNNVLNTYLFALLNREVVRKVAAQNFTGSSGHRRVPAHFYENFKIPVPSLAEQSKIIAEIESLEKQIDLNQAIIEAAAGKKQEVMKKYL